MQYLESPIFWGLVGIVGVILSIALSSMVTYKLTNRKVFEYHVTSTQLITEEQSSIPNLTIEMFKRPVKNLCVTHIDFTNCGNQSIELSDFASRAPFGISVDGDFYGYQAYANNPNADFHVDFDDQNKNKFYLKFDFLKPGQSFTVSLFHDGIVSVCGEMKTGKMRAYHHDKKGIHPFWPILVSGVLSFLLTEIMQYVIRSSYSDPFLLGELWIFVIALLMTLITAFFIYWIFGDSYRR